MIDDLTRTLAVAMIVVMCIAIILSICFCKQNRYVEYKYTDIEENSLNDKSRENYTRHIPGMWPGQMVL